MSNTELIDKINEIERQIRLHQLTGMTYDGVLLFDVLDEIKKKLNIEKHLGCPSDVFLGLATHRITEIYIEYDDFSGNYASPYCDDEDIRIAYVTGIYDSNEIDGLNKPEWKIETNMGTFPLSDYKKHFWLRKDKSEV